MKRQNSFTRNNFGIALFIGALMIAIIGCISLPSTSTDTSLQETQMELSIQQTVAAQNAVQQQQDQAQQPDLALQATQTQLALDVLTANQAMQATETAVAQALAAQQAEPQETESQEDTSSDQPAVEPAGDVDSMMKNAKILLFEDMVNRPGTKRYVKAALDNMNLEYKDDGSAKGWLKSDLLTQNWDLVIVALEVRGAVSGEYFEYINQALDNGSAVILEIWYMDDISRGTIASTLNRCGVEFEKDYVNKTWDSNDYLQWPLPNKAGHPIFNEPNKNFKFTNVAIYWFGDLGDFIKLSGKKEGAELLMGTIATEKNTHGTLAVCDGGKFIIQTFSSHDYAEEEIVPLWENTITYVLKNKFLGAQ
jgi:hypothetical protein